MGKKLKVGIIIVVSLLLIVFILGFVFIINPIIQMKKNPIDIVEKQEENIIDYNADKIISDEELEKIETANIHIIKEEKKLDEVVNILLVGLDARSYDTVSRSDSMMLISYNTTQHTAKIVSVMRDSWVYIPDFGWSRVNAATVYGGVGLLINTLNRNFDLDIQNYVQIKFEDFKNIIDLLGGLDIELNSEEIRYINYKLHTDDFDYKNDVVAEPGLVHLNGVQTLWHCRNRTIGNSDFSRTERQRHVLTLLVDKCLNMSAVQALEMLYEVKDYINTNIPISTMRNLLEDALIYRNIEIESHRIPFDNTYRYASKNGASVLAIDIQKNAEMLHDVFGYADTKKIDLPPQPRTREDIEAEEALKEEEITEDVSSEDLEIENIDGIENTEEMETVENSEEIESETIENDEEIIEENEEDIIEESEILEKTEEIKNP